MTVNLSALSPITTSATALAGLVLVSPQSTVGYQPQNDPNDDGSPNTAQQPPALLFHYEGEQTVTIESDITDHYVEDNTAIQDQIALKPEMVTTHGFIGELNDIGPYPLQLLKEAADKLTDVVAYTPQLTLTAQLAYAEAFQLYQTAAGVVNSAVSAVSSIGNLLTGSDGQNVINGSGLEQFNFATGSVAPSQNKQQTAFQQFYGYWSQRTLFTVQTPWAVFQNMAIKSLRAIQDAETNTITDFEVTFKMIRNASTITTGGGAALSYSGALSSQAASQTDLGTNALGPASSFSGAITAMG